MKSTITALCLLLAVLGCATADTIYFQKIFDEMIDITESLPEQYPSDEKEIKKQIDTLQNMWDEHFDTITFTVGYAQINKADTAINTLYIAYYCENKDDYAIARREAADALNRIEQLQSFHWKTIL